MARSSSPVASVTTRGRRVTLTSLAPAPAAATSAPGVSRVPAATTVSPAPKSLARALTKRAAPGASTILAWSPCASTFSWIITRSAPSGSAAPVKIRTACPSPAVPPNLAPAAEMPTTRSNAPATASPSRTAKPSIVDTLARGDSHAAATGAASTRPAAWSRVTGSANNVVAARATMAQASSRLISDIEADCKAFSIRLIVTWRIDASAATLLT